MLALFRDKIYLAVTVGHFTIDIFNNSGTVLVAFLGAPLGWTSTQFGFAIGAYQLFSALGQPLFGWLADKLGTRWMGPGSLAWTLSFLVISVIVVQQTENYWLFVIPFVLASIGSSAFHPLGTKHAAEEAALIAATGTAIFFLFGQTGLAVGPFLTGLILDSVGLSGLVMLAVLAVPWVLFMTFAMRNTKPDADASILHSSDGSKKVVRWGAIILLAVLIGLRSWALLGTVSFLPKLFQGMGWSATAYGLITGAFWMASAITGVLAGGFADRFGRREVTFITLLTGSIALYFLPLNSGWGAFPVAIIVGGLLGASHSILVIISQAILPGGRAFTSGVTLGFLFGTGALAAWGVGILADSWGLVIVIQAGAVVGGVSALLALALPSTRQSIQPNTEGAPAG